MDTDLWLRPSRFDLIRDEPVGSAATSEDLGSFRYRCVSGIAVEVLIGGSHRSYTSTDRAYDTHLRRLIRKITGPYSSRSLLAPTNGTSPE